MDYFYVHTLADEMLLMTYLSRKLLISDAYLCIMKGVIIN